MPTSISYHSPLVSCHGRPVMVTSLCNRHSIMRVLSCHTRASITQISKHVIILPPLVPLPLSLPLSPSLLITKAPASGTKSSTHAYRYPGQQDHQTFLEQSMTDWQACARTCNTCSKRTNNDWETWIAEHQKGEKAAKHHAVCATKQGRESRGV